MRERGTVRREKEDRGTEVCVGGRGGRGVGRGDNLRCQSKNRIQEIYRLNMARTLRLSQP